ncbi:MAG: hypothetical protein KKE86_11425 [Planctomycetes bacterium]|nr:hypothetical protein [Planctomycetota bacterium]
MPRVGRDYRARYRTIGQVLDKSSEILDAVHQDIKHLSQGDRKGRKGDFTTDYEVYEKQQPDCDLTRPVIERHEKLFGERPEVLAADKGFCPEKSKFEELAKLVVNLAIPRRMQDFMDKVLAGCQAFRAGIEGTISGLKRAFRWVRCFFRGFKGFAGTVGLGVFCHNLIGPADHESG